ncbi:polymorphic toxin type 35 domain-containing protein [Macrococcus equipercicus]|uniref:polymorphic toxin type 35 domain-containing protein n=1 Tax=Macrococcus equipercicus TaxID=69967 RepID=UPI0014796A4A|nr:polymorphic toxin type 35 domain-containing protein [Macrococcus equipercicus]
MKKFLKIFLTVLFLIGLSSSFSKLSYAEGQTTIDLGDTSNIFTLDQDVPNTGGGGGFPLIIRSNSVLPYISSIGKNSNNVSHILRKDHLWKEISSGKWEDLERIMSATMRYGSESKYKKSALKKVYTKYGRSVVVTYVRKNGQILVSDGWVVPK